MSASEGESSVLESFQFVEPAVLLRDIAYMSSPSGPL